MRRDPYGRTLQSFHHSLTDSSMFSDAARSSHYHFAASNPPNVIDPSGNYAVIVLAAFIATMAALAIRIWVHCWRIADLACRVWYRPWTQLFFPIAPTVGGPVKTINEEGELVWGWGEVIPLYFMFECSYKRTATPGPAYWGLPADANNAKILIWWLPSTRLPDPCDAPGVTKFHIEGEIRET